MPTDKPLIEAAIHKLSRAEAEALARFIRAQPNRFRQVLATEGKPAPAARSSGTTANLEH